MIIDFHTHAFPDELARRAIGTLLENIDEDFKPVTDGTVSGLLAHMAQSGVDISVVQPVVTKPSQFVGLNEWAASLASDRLIPFGGIYPNPNTYKQDVDFVVSLGLKGLKFHCEFQDFIVDSPDMLRIYDYALRRGLILLHHAGPDPAYPAPYRSSPRQFARIADAMKGGVIVAAHLGGHEEWDDVERYLVGKNIYLDTSIGLEFFEPAQFLRIIRNHGEDKILFASDSPWSDAAAEIKRLKALGLPSGDKTAILGGNAARILGL